MNDLLCSLNHENVSVLTLLDLSAAFDTINHTFLLQRLEHVFGIHETALHLFSSYLTNKTQTATENNCSSGPVTISCGVPQGSVVSFCRPHLSLMLWTAILFFFILLLMTLNCKNLSVHNMLINSFNPYKSASITLSRG